MTMPARVKTESAVRRYLDSLYKGDKVEIIKFAEFTSMKDQLEQDKQSADKLDSNFFKSHPNMSKKDRVRLIKSTDSMYADAINREKGYWILCEYKIRSNKLGYYFWVTPDFKSVHLITIAE